MPLPTYLHPWRRLLVGAAVLGAVGGAALAAALPGADRTSGVVALAQALVVGAGVWILFYAFCRCVIAVLRRSTNDPGFAREPHLFPEGFALAAVAFAVAAVIAAATWAALGRGFVL